MNKNNNGDTKVVKDEFMTGKIIPDEKINIKSNLISHDALSLYNVQYVIEETNIKVNDFIFAFDMYNAQEIIAKQYQNYHIIDVYVQEVDIYYGLIIRA